MVENKAFLKMENKVWSRTGDGDSISSHLCFYENELMCPERGQRIEG